MVRGGLPSGLREKLTTKWPNLSRCCRSARSSLPSNSLSPVSPTCLPQDRLQASKRRRTSAAVNVDSPVSDTAATAEEAGEDVTTGQGVLPPMPLTTPPVAASSTRGSSSSNGGGGGGGGGYDDDAGEKPSGDMATTTPRLFLWEPREGRASTGREGLPARRREVTFRGDGEARDNNGAGDRPSTIPPAGVGAETAGTAAGGGAASAVMASEGQGERVGGGSGRVGGGSGSVLRPDFIQLSYAMKKAPDAGRGAVGRGIDAERGAQRGQVGVFVLLSVAVQYLVGISVVSPCVRVLGGGTRPR